MKFRVHYVRYVEVVSTTTLNHFMQVDRHSDSCSSHYNFVCNGLILLFRFNTNKSLFFRELERFRFILDTKQSILSVHFVKKCFIFLALVWKLFMGFPKLKKPYSETGTLKEKGKQEGPGSPFDLVIKPSITIILCSFIKCDHAV